MKNLRTLGLAAVMALALGAFVGVASASASVGLYVSEKGPLQFEAEKYPVSTFGSGKGFHFKFFGEKEGSCTTVPNYRVEIHPAFWGEMTGPGNIMPARPEFGEGQGCTAEETPVSFPPEWESNSHCAFVNSLTERIFSWFATGPARFVCEQGLAGWKFSQTVSGKPVCTVTVPPQDLGNVAYYWNEGTGSSRSITTRVLPVKMTYTRTGEGCLHGTGTFTDGSIELYFGTAGL